MHPSARLEVAVLQRAGFVAVRPDAFREVRAAAEDVVRGKVGQLRPVDDGRAIEVELVGGDEHVARMFREPHGHTLRIGGLSEEVAFDDDVTAVGDVDVGRLEIAGRSVFPLEESRTAAVAAVEETVADVLPLDSDQPASAPAPSGRPRPKLGRGGIRRGGATGRGRRVS
jgi:hypothetical protein